MLPKTSDVVVIGGGVMGSSVAYHLAARGGLSVTLLEREEQFMAEEVIDGRARTVNIDSLRYERFGQRRQVSEYSVV